MGNVNLLYGTGREEVSIGLFCFWSGRIKDGCGLHRLVSSVETDCLLTVNAVFEYIIGV